MLARRAGGEYRRDMPEDHIHAGHRAIVARLKRSPIHDHVGHHVTWGDDHDLAGIKTVTRLH